MDNSSCAPRGLSGTDNLLLKTAILITHIYIDLPSFLISFSVLTDKMSKTGKNGAFPDFSNTVCLVFPHWVVLAYVGLKYIV